MQKFNCLTPETKKNIGLGKKVPGAIFFPAENTTIPYKWSKRFGSDQQVRFWVVFGRAVFLIFYLVQYFFQKIAFLNICEKIIVTRFSFIIVNQNEFDIDYHH